MALNTRISETALVASETDKVIIASSHTTTFVHRDTTAFIPLRYWMVVLCFVGFTFVFILRVNIGVAIVAMINTTAQTGGISQFSEAVKPVSLVVHQCPSAAEVSHNVTQIARGSGGEFNWSEQTKAQILSSFYYGYLLTVLLGGYLSHRFGSYLVFGLSILFTSLPTLLTASAARWSPWALLTVRVIEGAADGVASPALHTFWSHWAPVQERTRLVGLTYAGGVFGSIVGSYLSGWLTQSYGWPTVFYVSGVAATLWCVLWFVFAASRPRESRWISASELKFIESSLDRHHHEQESVQQQLPSIPWKKFATSPPVYALCVSHFACNWNLTTFSTYTPSYLANVLKFTPAQAGGLNAIPFALQCIVHVVGNFAADFLRRCRSGTPVGPPRRTTMVRKLMNGIGLFGPAIFVALVPTAGCDATAALLFLSLTMGLLAGSAAGFLVNHVDIAAEYAGYLMTLTCTVGTVSSLLVPTVAAALAGPSRQQTVESWSRFFYVSSGIYIFGGLFYTAFASGERLPWLNDYIRGKQQIQGRSEGHVDSGVSVVGQKVIC